MHYSEIFPLKLSQKINKHIAIAFIVTLCVSVLILIPLQKKKATIINQKITSLIHTFLTNDMGPLANAIFEGRTRAIDIRLKTIQKVPGIDNVYVFNYNRTLVIGTSQTISLDKLIPQFDTAQRHDKNSWVENNRLWYLKPIHSFEEIIGFILVEYNIADMKRTEDLSIILYTGILTILILILLLVSHHLIRKIILRPVDDLIGNMEKIEDGNYGGQIHTISKDEIGSLALRFNAMSKEIAGSYRKIELQNHELQQTKNLLNNIINALPSLLITVDHDLKIHEWNHSASARANLPFSQAKGKPLNEVFSLLASKKELLLTAIEKRKIEKISKVAVLEGTKQLLLDFMVYPIEADNRWVIIIDDITDAVRMETMMIQTEKMMSVGGLAAGMAHEINNPLAGMIQNAQVIQNRMTKNLPANQKIAEDLGISIDTIRTYMERRKIFDLLTGLRKSGERATQIVNNMLSFSRQNLAEFSKENLCELLNKTISLAQNDYNLKNQFDFKQIAIHKQYDPDMPLVECEGNNIQQVFLNVLKNGAEAMHEKISGSDDKPQFVIRVQNNKDMACIEIQDNGPGIDEETRKRIFEPFFTTKSVGLGTGLGLSVSYFIITKNHNGEMSVESTPNAGTTFIIKLPYDQQPSDFIA